MKRRLAVSIVGRAISATIQIAVVALIARHLGVDEFGVFSATMSLTFGAMALLELGMGARVLRGTTDQPGRASLTTFAIVRGVILISAPLIALWLAFAGRFDPWLVVVTVVYAAGETTGDLAVGILQGDRRSVTAMSVLILRRLVALAPLLISATPESVLIAAGGAGALGVAFFSAIVLRRLARPRRLNELIKENLGVMLSGGAANAAQLDVGLVGASFGAYTAGLYGAGTRLANPVNLAISTMLQVLVPELASRTDPVDKVHVFRRARRFVLIGAATIACSSALAPWVVVVLFGEEFASAAPVAVAVFIAAAISSISQLHMSWLYSTHVPMRVPVGMWIAVVVGLCAILLLGWWLGLIGLGAGIVLTQVLTMVAIVIPADDQIRRMSA